MKHRLLSVAIGTVLYAVTSLLLACCTPTAGQPLQRLTQGAPPAPVPPNGSRVIAHVFRYSPVSSFVPSDEAPYSLLVDVLSSHGQEAGLESLARPGVRLEVFGAGLLPADLVGKNIEATLTLTGDTGNVRWRISDIHVLP
jgi:hypothetical protein